MLGLDKIIIDMISIIIGGVGLIGAITKFDVANSRKTFYGENPFARKEEAINNSIVIWFTFYAALGLIFQLIFGSILGDLIAERLYPRSVYFIGLALSIPYSYLIVKFIQWMGKESAKKEWQPDLANLFKEHYLSAKFIVENNGRSKDDGEVLSESNKISNYKTAEKTIARIEELFDISPSNEDDLTVRINRFAKYFQL